MGKKVVEIIYCDRCKKEAKDEELVHVCDAIDHYFYDFCKDCHKVYEEYANEIEKIEKEWEAVKDEYKFGHYLFEDNEVNYEVI